MIRDEDMRRRLNLVQSSRTFVLKEVGSDGEAIVISPKVIPKGDGIYWVGGVTTLRNGLKLPSVFRVDTDAAGNLVSVFWQVNGAWYQSDSEEARRVLGIMPEETFPFDWSYNVPLEADAFHS